MKTIKGGITTPLGFKANGIASGIKRSGKLDLGLIFSERPATASGVFTKNSVKAAPLLISQKNLRHHQAQAVVVNSGNANCFTGSFGYLYAKKTTELFGKLLNVKPQHIVVASTGIIGKPLPYLKIKAASQKLVKGLANTQDAGRKTAKAILTTDLKTKEACVRCTLDGKKVLIAGCAKGSGMIAPNMATMLGFITTDAAISGGMLQAALRQANEETFNRITIDGCMSTNDMVVVMANGLAGNKPMTMPGKDYQGFLKALKFVCLDLAKKIVVDGEGATKLIEIRVTGAKSESQAKTVGLQIGNSVLVKTAAFGSNPNWGRVAAAVGSLAIKKVTEDHLKIKFSSFAKKHIVIHVDLNIGRHQSVVYTSDLSYEYVRINAEYN
ncbi:MAG: bifunctional glutamate N-acetyltransferase/amino-acid acetyltransferase ArgJ [Candidatus Omnitrophota bacterium]|nr:bifunctional glutamate N-acetyltransferase/amino-acid acetyltransferase ArgJ [Candidatus Omnitrophota bacterium]